MSLLNKLRITFGDKIEGSYTTPTTFKPNRTFDCLFFEKRQSSFANEGDFLDYDKVAVVDGYQDNGSIAFFDNVYYRIVEISSLQNNNQPRQKFHIKLKFLTKNASDL